MSSELPSDTDVGLPDRPSTDAFLNVGGHNLLASDMLRVHGGNTYNIFTIREDDGVAELYCADTNEFREFTEADCREFLAREDTYHWRILNRQDVTRHRDGNPVAIVFYTFTINTPAIEEQYDGEKLGLCFAFESFPGMTAEELSEPLAIDTWALYPTLSRMEANVLNPAQSEQVESLASLFEEFPSLRKVVTSVMVSTDHNAHVRHSPSEPRLYPEQNFDIVDSQDIIEILDDLCIADEEDLDDVADVMTLLEEADDEDILDWMSETLDDISETLDDMEDTYGF